MWRGQHSAMVCGIKEMVRSDSSPQPVGGGGGAGGVQAGSGRKEPLWSETTLD